MIAFGWSGEVDDTENEISALMIVPSVETLQALYFLTSKVLDLRGQDISGVATSRAFESLQWNSVIAGSKFYICTNPFQSILDICRSVSYSYAIQQQPSTLKLEALRQPSVTLPSSTFSLLHYITSSQGVTLDS